jgi:hypothetical protein
MTSPLGLYLFSARQRILTQKGKPSIPDQLTQLAGAYGKELIFIIF